MKTVILSRRGEPTKVKGEFFVCFTAVSPNGTRYETIHLTPSGSGSSHISADELNEQWQKRFNGLSPFSGDKGFEIIHLQQRF